MHDPTRQATIIRPVRADATSRVRPASGTLPPDLVADAVSRLKASLVIYALGFFLAGMLPAMLFKEARAMYFGNVQHWLAPSVSIGTALGLLYLVSRPALPDAAKLRLGLLFLVLGSVGISIAEFQGVTAPIMTRSGPGGFGLSWVVAWVLIFAVMVPTRPRLATAAAACAVASVPLTYAVGVRMGVNLALPPVEFFLSLVLPYMVVVVLAHVASRVVYDLGTAVRKARELGSYRLEERLGAGGMGEVWRARHHMLARPAAIKLIRPGALGAGTARDEALARFEREAQATALLRSPHTVSVYDFGVTDEGDFYYVMELLDGFDLEELVRRFGPLPAGRAIHFLRQACDSLGEAHAAGLLHRDIKPANLHACRQGRDVDFIKVLDFGLVEHVDAGPPGAEGARPRPMGGTPAYMSPEQVVGDEELDARSDVYSLGCVAYWLLTGRTAFSGATPLETMLAHVSTSPAHPSSLVAGVPPELEGIVLDCLAKEPGARPQSMDDLALRLGTVVVAPPWTDRESRSWWTAHAPPAGQAIGVLRPRGAGGATPASR